MYSRAHWHINERCKNKNFCEFKLFGNFSRLEVEFFKLLKYLNLVKLTIPVKSRLEINNLALLFLETNRLSIVRFIFTFSSEMRTI